MRRHAAITQLTAVMGRLAPMYLATLMARLSSSNLLSPRSIAVSRYARSASMFG